MLRVFLKLNPPVILIIESSSLFSIYASGKVKEMTGVSPTKDQVEKLSEQDVEKYFKRFEASLSSKTHDAMVIHLFSCHVQHWLIFSLLMKGNF